jgi:predicted tellurium resistance membrane protein TerC
VELHQIWEWVLSLSTLALLEIVLGIDNLVIISILSEKLPEHQKSKRAKLALPLPLS